ncbi:MAG TPA: GntR family transcriptional regulator [Actinobacteria bacterium]|nr:GntR family transcriptional regulator [Actinomycetota bacterium]
MALSTDGGDLDRASPVPLWAQLVERLREAIALGRYDDGFPSEHDLTERYGVSRHTVREALRRLEQDGLLVRRRGRPTSVNRPIRQELGTLYSLFRTVEAQGIEQRSRVLALDVVAAPEVAARLGLPDDEPLVYLKRIRNAAGVPLALDEAWLPARRAEPLLEADFTHTALYDELERHCGFVPIAGEETIQAVVPSDEDCRILGVEPGTAMFVLERRTRDPEGFVEWRRTLLRADRFRFVAEWRAGVPATPRLTVSE